RRDWSGDCVAGSQLARSAVLAIVDRAVPNGAIAPVDAASWAITDRLTALGYKPDIGAALITEAARGP
ncbi:MAG: hypothetical protein ACRDGQ_13325, partial [Candidatus Limnocylindrales bacterium]